MLLQLENADLNYGKIQALHGISVEVAEGEVVSLIGANGAGKTSTMRALSGVRGLSAVAYVLLFLSPLLQITTRVVPALALLAAPWVVLALLLLWRELEGMPARPAVDVATTVDGGGHGAP